MKKYGIVIVLLLVLGLGFYLLRYSNDGLVYAYRVLGTTDANNVATAHKENAELPKNPVVPRPDEIYVTGKDYVVRVREDSRWFNIFWGLVDKVSRYDTGDTSIGWGPFGNYDKKLARPPIQGLHEVPIKPGQVILQKSNTGEINDELVNTNVILWYNNRSRLFLDKVRIGKETKPFLLDMDGSGHAIEWSQTGSTYWVRMIMLGPGSEKPEDTHNGYSLLLENSQPIKVQQGDNYKPRPYFSGYSGRPINYNARNDFKRLIPFFESEEVKNK